MNVRKIAYTMALYSMALIRALLGQNPDLHVTIISTKDDRNDVTEMPDPDRLQLCRCFTWNAWGLLSLMWKVRWATFDVVHLQHETFLYGGPLSLFLFPCVVRWIRRRTPTIVTLHHVIHPHQITAEFAAAYHAHLPPALIRWGFALFYRWIGSAASQCIVHESCDKTTLVEAYGLPADRISVVFHGADIIAPAPARERTALLQKFNLPVDAEHVFGFFGYLDLSKGLDLLIEEFLAHLIRHPHDTLIIGGALNPHNTQDQTFIEKLQGLQERTRKEGSGRIHWYGEVPSEDVKDFYALLDALIIPYRVFNGGSATLSRAISYDLPCLLSEAFAACDTGPAMIFPLHKGGLRAILEECHSRERLPRPSDPPFSTWSRERLWPAVGAKTLSLYDMLHEPRKTRDVLLLGAYGQDNLGDELLLETCLRHLPRHACTVASAHPAETESMHGVRAVPSRFSIALLRAFLSAKTVVVGGGDQFKLLKKSMHHSAHSLLLRELWIVAAAKLLRKKVYFVGVGIGTIDTRLARALTSTILRMADAVTLRDRMSMRTALALAPHAAVQASADLAFLEEPSSDTAPAHVEHAPCRLGIAPVFMLDHAQAFPAVLQAVGGASDAFLKKDSERQVIFLPFQTGSHHHHDVITSEEILAHMSLHNRCRIDDHLNVETAKNVFRSIDMLWGMRLHSIILACLYQVPFVALIYDIKVRQFLEDIDCLHWSIPLDETFTAEKLLTMSDQLETQLPDMRLHLHRQAKKLHALAGINEQLFRTIVADMTGYPASHCRFDTLLSES